jgi:hypothetical protein
MAARAHEISLEAGSKMAAAMKDVINAAAGLTGFAIESARDLVQYMVRRGQMTQDEADKLIREAEEAHGKRSPALAASAKPSSANSDHQPPRPAPKAVEKPAPATLAPPTPPAAKAVSAVTPPKAAKPAVAAAKPAVKPAAKHPTVKKATIAPKKSAPSKGAVKRAAVAKASAKPAKKK